MKLCLVGTGYVGLVSGACFAETGQRVVCADRNVGLIDQLKGGLCPLFEPGLQSLVRRNHAAGRLRFTSDVAAAISDADVVFVAVGTPAQSDGSAELGAVEAVAQMVATHVKRRTVLVLKSTVPVGTSARVRALVAGAGFPIHVVSNPEFLKEGDAVNDFMKPDRIVIGLDPSDSHARLVMTRLYHPLNLDGQRLVWMSPESAELTKYASNTLLAMRISFMNEMAGLCDRVGADIHEVRRGVGSDTRIGPRFLYAGPGYGGSCFPKDVRSLAFTGRQVGLELTLTEATHRVNERQKRLVFEKLQAEIRHLKDRKIAIWGVTFKPQTDDTRESPSLVLIDALTAVGAHVVCHDPQAARSSTKQWNATWSDSAYEAAEGADALCLMTEWRQYQNPDFTRLKSLMGGNLIIDARNIWSTYGLADLGFVYRGIGTR